MGLARETTLQVLLPRIASLNHELFSLKCVYVVCVCVCVGGTRSAESAGSVNMITLCSPCATPTRLIDSVRRLKEFVHLKELFLLY